MFCTKCGNKIEDNSRFCGECGNSVFIENNKSNNYKDEFISENDVNVDYDNIILINQAKKIANTQILKGLGFMALGGLITLITYLLASDGGTYFVFWGIAIYGAYIFIKGLFWRVSPKSLIKESQN